MILWLLVFITVESSAGVLMSSLGNNNTSTTGSVVPGMLSADEATRLKVALGVGSSSPQQQLTTKGATLPRGRSATSTAASPSAATLTPQTSSQIKTNPMASSTSSLFR